MTRAKAVFVEQSEDRWRIELRDLKALRKAMGPETVNAFCRCFVHGDRLVSMATHVKASLDLDGQDSPAYERNLDAIFWLSIGSMHELAIAIRNLRTALKKRDILDHASASWTKLSEIQSRWIDDPFFSDVRNGAAFHVDRDIVERGLGVLETHPTAILGYGSGPKLQNFSARLGRDALMLGLGWSETDLERFVKQLSSDHHDAAEAINNAFVDAIEAAGVQLVWE